MAAAAPLLIPHTQLTASQAPKSRAVDFLVFDLQAPLSDEPPRHLSRPSCAGSYVGLDPFDRTLPDEAERLGLTAATRLRTEALLLRAPPSRCNAEAVAAPWATALPALWRDELIAGASHCDFESPTDWMCRLACGDTDPARQQRVRQGLLEAASRWMR